MGAAKAQLPFGPQTMLQRIVDRLSQVCQPIVVVCAAGQSLPSLSGTVVMAHDAHPDRGPLEGLAAGLRALPATVQAAFLTTCDAPLLMPDFVRRLHALLGEHSIVVPVADGFQHPLTAVYRTSVLPVIEALLAADRLRPSDLLEVVSTCRVGPRDWSDVDPHSWSLKNVNTPQEYADALALAGFAVDSALIARLRQVASRAEPGG